MNSQGARRTTSERASVQMVMDDEPISARETDTVASALIAAGYRVFATDPHDGSPRGGFCFVGRCSDCLMIIDGQPGTMACRTPVRSGMRVETQQGHGHWAEEGAS